jgi:hypothetical protein
VATHDYVIANGTGAAVRSDLNDALAAIVSQNSSSSAPATMYAYMLWADTTAGIMKMRNGANSAWISLWELDGTFIATDISLSAGTAGAPSLYFTGDTNTGIYSPGADQVAISTSGTGRLFINSNGDINIGHSSSSYSGAGRGLISVNGSSSSIIDLQTGATSRFRMFCNGTDVELINTEATGVIKFGTNSAERMRLTSAGLLGLGTSTPGAKLHILDSTSTAVELLRLETGWNSPSGNKSITWADGTNVLGRISVDYTSPTAKMRFGSLYDSGYQTSDLMTLTPTGLGIGTSAPADALHLASGNFRLTNGAAFVTVNSLIRSISSFAGSANQFETTRISSLTGAFVNRGEIAFSTGDDTSTCVERVRIDYLGRVGIGTTSPAPYAAGAIPVHIHGGANPSELRLTTNASGQASATDGAVLQLSGTTLALWNAENDAILFGTNNGEAARIDSSKRLLVGTSTARSNFFGTTLSAVTQTEGTGGAAGRGSLSVINNDVSNNPPYVLLGRSGAATLGSNAAVVSGSRLGTLTFHGADGTSFIEAATVAGEVDGTPGTNDMPGRLVFSVTADGASSPTERFRIGSAGQLGIGGATYGTSGQVLTSGGASAAPSWQDAGGGAGTLKAWVNFNGTGTVAIRASGNVSSITDNGTGDYTVNFTTAIVDADYSVNITTGNPGNAGSLTALFASGGTQTEAAPTTSAFRFTQSFQPSANQLGDLKYICVSIFR